MSAFAISKAGLEFRVDIFATGQRHDSFDFAFDPTRPADPLSCQIRAKFGSLERTCELVAGGGGVDDGIGRWTFNLAIPLGDFEKADSVELSVAWARQQLPAHDFTISRSDVEIAANKSSQLMLPEAP